VAVEYSKEAVACARLSFKGIEAEAKGKLQLFAETVEQYLQNRTITPGLIIVNPPRKGLSKEALDLILKQKSDAVIYVSCAPDTLARDLKTFVHHGYSIQAVKGLDLFPQTSHFETIVVLTRK
jgi:23S rRNA (uracil1939-C5)-methyltransferase